MSQKTLSINNLNSLEFVIDEFNSFFTKNEYKTVFGITQDKVINNLKKSLIGLSNYGKKYLEETNKQKLKTIILKLSDTKTKVKIIFYSIKIFTN